LFVAVLASGAPALGADFYVSPRGSNLNPAGLLGFEVQFQCPQPSCALDVTLGTARLFRPSRLPL
jgi:hypothetical protein